MSIEKKDLDNIAKLARIALDEKDRQNYTQDINQILSMVDAIQQVDTTDIAPLQHPLDAKQRLRVDLANTESERNKAQTLTKEIEQDLYIVPKVIED